jgi:hypothetical protein
MSNKIRLDIDIINIRFKYSDTDTVSDVEYSNSDTNRFFPLNEFGLEYGRKIFVPFSSLSFRHHAGAEVYYTSGRAWVLGELEQLKALSICMT